MKSRAHAGVLAACLTLSAIGAAARAPSLEQAFRTCVGLPTHLLAGDLMRSVWEVEERSTFAARHETVTRGYRVVDPGADETAARTAIVDLIRPAPVAGVRPLALSATACEFGCRLRMWSLEFGVLSASQADKLAGWVAAAPTPVGRSGRVEFVIDADGSAALICDIDR